MTEARVVCGDNLQVLKELRAADERFDLVELDGPYMAGLEDWDNLTEAEYIQHYADRLTIVRDLLQPWGVVFVFGYPEGCAEIKSWAYHAETLYLRRWLTWYKQVTAHKGRKVETILFLLRPDWRKTFDAFKEWLRNERKQKGWTIAEACAKVGIRKTIAPARLGGFLWYESEASTFPSWPVYQKLDRVFNIPARFKELLWFDSYGWVTDTDFFSRTYPEKTEAIGDDRLRSKPVQLYVDLFKPTIPPTETRRALVLYGGSGNAAIASTALGYDTTVIELDPQRCELIEQRAAVQVGRWRRKLSQLEMFENRSAVQQAMLL